MLLDSIIRNAVSITPDAKTLQKIADSKQMRVKFGVDPTNADLHLGHTVPLRLLRNFQRLGHKPVIIIGTVTAWIGDPSGRDDTRRQLTWQQIVENKRKYVKHLEKFIDLQHAEVHDNCDWFGTMNFIEIMTLVGSMTVQQILQREDFTRRLAANKPINLLELVYPLMQGRDSVAINADVEIGGTDQLFNFNVGRELQKSAGQEPQVCITLPLLPGTDGVRKMGKCLNNYIAVDEAPFEMFSKIMSIPDSCLKTWFRLLTDWNGDEITQMCVSSPFYQKLTLAGLLVEEAHGKDKARTTEEEWMRRFSDREDPENPPEVFLSPGPITVLQLLRAVKFADSNNAARRLIQPTSCVSIGTDRKTKIIDPNQQVEVTDGLIVRAGSRRVVKIRCSAFF